MSKTDVNCLIGHWPFRKIAKNTLEDLKKVHEANGITGGYVSSLNSIFYNDPFEGDEELHEIIKGTAYKHVLTVNPTLPCFESDMISGLKRFDIKAVRIYPGYHGYKLIDDCVESLCNILVEHNLPLFLTLRMEDERLDHIVQPRPLGISEIRDFLETNSCLKTVLLSIRVGEIAELKDCIKSRSNILFDTSELKAQVFNIDNLVEEFTALKIVYGSLHPLYCLKSTILQVEKAKLDDDAKNFIFSKNMEQFLRT